MGIDSVTDKPLHCWEYNDCPESLCAECPVFVDKAIKCWEYEDTRCSAILGFEPDCRKCRYYRAAAEPVSRPIRNSAEDKTEQ